jgi:4-amino-4-deoxy-L-arabinose transferase-like glycosyltransferase
VAKPSPISTTLSRVSWWLYLGLLAAVALVYRFLQWNQLPPGLSTAEASSGIAAALISKGAAGIGYRHETGYSPLWELLQGASVHIFGNTISALRILPALLGLIAVATTYGWVRSWYDRRTAWVAAFLVAVLPWSVSLSRNAVPTILSLIFITSLLWAATCLMRKPNSVLRVAVLVGTIILSLAAGPWGWLSLIAVAIALSFQRKLISRNIGFIRENKLTFVIAFGALAIALAVIAYLAKAAIAPLATSFGIAPASNWFISALRVGGMFFYHGDPDFHHNLGGEPMVNAFIALAYVAGLLLSISRIQRARDRMLIILLILGLIPAVISGGLIPNAARAALALPIVAVLAAIGTYYLADLWSATFPINSAARSLGQTAISLLLVLTAFQCYTQYFVAWANSSETYVAYNRGATAAAVYLGASKLSAETTVIAGDDEIPTEVYLLADKPAFIINAKALKQLPTGKPRLLIITAEVHDQAVVTLQERFPGGTLKAHLDRDGSELFYDYMIAK